MKALSITFGASVLACGNGPCANSQGVGSSYGFGEQAPSFAQTNFATQFIGQNNGASPFSTNKPWQGSVPTNWQNSPSSVWTPSQVVASPAPARMPATPRPPNPSLAGRSPSEQLQITKCRSAQSCEKCRQLNCYWDSTAKITNRCIALGLESTQIPVEAGQASNLGYCPTTGQQGYAGVNWLAIENSGAAVPNLDGMSDANVQQWLSSIPNYDPDATAANYPAGDAFKELLPTAAKAYADGKIPSTTPWISFFDSLSSIGGGYTYDGYDSSYTYDLPSSDYYGGSYGSFGSSGFGSSSSIGALSTFGSSWDNSYPASAFGPSTTAFSGSLSTTCCGQATQVLPQFPGFSQPLPSFPQQLGSFPQQLGSFPQQLGSSFPQLGSSFPQQPGSSFPQLGSSFSSFGSPLPSQPSFGAALSGSPIGFGAPLPTQPIGFGTPLSQPNGFSQPSFASQSPTWP